MIEFTPEYRAQLLALAEAATPGPWEHYNSNEGTTYGPFWGVANDEFHNPSPDNDAPWLAVELHTGIEADAEFIAAARSAVPALLDALEAAEREHHPDCRSAVAIAQADRRAAEAALARVKALADEWEHRYDAGDHMVGCPDGTAYYDLVADELSAALAEPTPHEAAGGAG